MSLAELKRLIRDTGELDEDGNTADEVLSAIVINAFLDGYLAGSRNGKAGAEPDFPTLFWSSETGVQLQQYLGWKIPNTPEGRAQ